jgi:hypothetical protein
LLHLLKNNYNNFQEEYLGPEIITAQGIKNSVECTLGYLSLLYKKYKQEGFIYRKKMKIEKKTKTIHILLI